MNIEDLEKSLNKSNTMSLCFYLSVLKDLANRWFDIVVHRSFWERYTTHPTQEKSPLKKLPPKKNSFKKLKVRCHTLPYLLSSASRELASSIIYCRTWKI